MATTTITTTRIPEAIATTISILVKSNGVVVVVVDVVVVSIVVVVVVVTVVVVVVDVVVVELVTV